jgi:hypothetical protein
VALEGMNTRRQTKSDPKADQPRERNKPVPRPLAVTRWRGSRLLTMRLVERLDQPQIEGEISSAVASELNELSNSSAVEPLGTALTRTLRALARAS